MIKWFIEAIEEARRKLFTLILNPAFALVSMNMMPNSRALLSPSSIETCLQVKNIEYIDRIRQH